MEGRHDTAHGPTSDDHGPAAEGCGDVPGEGPGGWILRRDLLAGIAAGVFAERRRD